MSRRKQTVLGQILGGVLTASSRQESEGESAAVAEPPKARPQARTQPRSKPARPAPKALPQWNVVLLDDDDHSYQYVIEMLGCVFGHNLGRAFQMAREVDSTGRVIVFTTHRELAELKRDQIIRYGTDPRISTSRGGMGAVIEPARS